METTRKKRGRPAGPGGAATEIVRLRVQPERKRAWVGAARRRGETLTGWITRGCDEQISP